MSNLHGNWVDLLIFLFLLFYAWEGYERGFLALVSEMVSFVASFLIALRFYSLAAGFLVNNFSLSLAFGNALGFILVAIFTEVIIATVIAELLRKLPGEWFTSHFNRILGPLPAVIDGLILVAFLTTALVGLPVMGAIKNDILNSRISSFLISQTHGLEKTLSGVFGGAVQETLSFITVSPDSRQRIDLRFRTTNLKTAETDEVQMLVLVNQERAKVGVKSLTMDSTLREVARAHSRDMFERGYFSHIDPDGHDPFDRMKAAGASFTAAGENIAYAPSLSVAHDGLMNSPGHRANILSPDFGKVGIGIIDGGVYGKMFSQEFTN
jgi:uncharacterized protein YkwD/uncharacterized membrane protein required for colicin V production